MTIAASGSSSPLFRHAALGLLTVAVVGCIPTGPTGTTTYNGVCPTCIPDPGWALQDCAAAEAGLEFFSPTVGDFEYTTTDTSMDSTAGQTVNAAKYMYGYTDGTASTNANAGYQPKAVAADRCTGQSGNHAFHLVGGPFLGWGGGIGVAMQHLVGDAGCVQMVNAVSGDYCYPYSPDSTGDTLSYATLDMSKWEGISVWARRGPSSQPLLRMLVGTKDTDDDVSFLMLSNDVNTYHTNTPRYCERVKDCACQFQDAPCTHFASGDPALPTAYAALPDGAWFCGAPGATPSYVDMGPATSFNNTCNTTRCNDAYPAYAMTTADAKGDVGDPAFFGKPCTAYRTRNGILSSYCYDPASDPPPASTDQQCGDHFTFPLSLTTEWQLFLVPFSTMYQQGWAKKAAYFDLHTVSVVRLTWDAGNIDYWIDNLSFYRHKKAQ
jgi:hypothetical protein